MACAYYPHTPFIIPELRHVRQEKTTQMPTGKVSGSSTGRFFSMASTEALRQWFKEPNPVKADA